LPVEMEFQVILLEGVVYERDGELRIADEKSGDLGVLEQFQKLSERKVRASSPTRRLIHLNLNN
jgi:hypothetical protein